MISYLKNQQITLPAYCGDRLWHLNLDSAKAIAQELLMEVRCHDHRVHKSSCLTPEREAVEQTDYATEDFRTHIGRSPTQLEQLCLKIHFLELSLIEVYIGNKYDIGTTDSTDSLDVVLVNYPPELNS
ncbi:MAG: hypothetical protein OQK12_15910 [Motiliproteus sp.]|nr:hypothetical protein [Motiliproteus sp.]MCW9051421.1 hypothetical protein [Motiliproteus sp.]